jgi:hypothetical protein
LLTSSKSKFEKKNFFGLKKKVAKVDRKILLRVVLSWLIPKCITSREFVGARMGIRVKLNGASRLG